MRGCAGRSVLSRVRVPPGSKCSSREANSDCRLHHCSRDRLASTTVGRRGGDVTVLRDCAYGRSVCYRSREKRLTTYVICVMTWLYDIVRDDEWTHTRVGSVSSLVRSVLWSLMLSSRNGSTESTRAHPSITPVIRRCPFIFVFSLSSWLFVVSMCLQHRTLNALLIINDG